MADSMRPPAGRRSSRVKATMKGSGGLGDASPVAGGLRGSTSGTRKKRKAGEDESDEDRDSDDLYGDGDEDDEDNDEEEEEEEEDADVSDEDEECDEDWLHDATREKKKKKAPKAARHVTGGQGAAESKKRKTGSSLSSREVGVSKSAAEFFAENQSIAGFDNRGRSLYTTIRELVENSLDACESAEVLPDVQVDIEELTQAQFNELRGMAPDAETQRNSERAPSTKGEGKEQGASVTPEKAEDAKATKNPSEEPAKSSSKKKKPSSSSAAAAEAYFRISVRDNGCGMAHDAIPDLLGRVLSGSKYGVRQTRGKFGLGAKMALIWSKKSTGVPITVKTALSSPTSSVQLRKPASHYTTCVLDIDIYHNEPRIIKHTSTDNSVQKWIGTQMSLVIAGNWTSYRSWILQYLQQLAIITPYANLELLYQNRSEPQRNISVRYDRRSEQMPSAAREVKHHPSSVNNLIIHQLLQRTKCKTLLKFLCTDLSSIGSPVAKRLLQELQQSLPTKETLDESTPPSKLTDLQITRLVQLLRRGKVSATAGSSGSTAATKIFKAPDASCLSSLGEYNLNLGIRKVLEPEVVATARDRAGAHDGHPFLVEAAVSIGGKAVPEGITVFRFANRIPLLFESFADVATRVAQRRVRWANYKIDQRRDRIGVFVSIVSTKVPFKGTGKEYIGDDIVEIQQSVKRALQSCCQQLRSHLTKRNALREARERQSRLAKYIPDISRSLMGIITTMQDRQNDNDETGRMASPRKLMAAVKASQGDGDLVKSLQLSALTEEKIAQRLKEAIKQQGDGFDDSEGGGTQDMDTGDKTSGKEDGKGRGVPVFLVPMHRLEESSFAQRDLRHPLFVFRPMFS